MKELTNLTLEVFLVGLLISDGVGLVSSHAGMGLPGVVALQNLLVKGD